MRALQVLQAVSRPRSRGSVRCVIGVIGGVMWWGAVLRLVVAPHGAGSWQGVVAAGWSLGLIPLHAVPVKLPGRRKAGRRGAQPPPGTGPRWQFGHQ
jgi:hypothetical protein